MRAYVSLAALFCVCATAPSAQAERYRPKPKNPEQLKEVVPRTSKSNYKIQGNLAVETDILLKEAHLSGEEVVNAAKVKEIIQSLEKAYRAEGYTLVRVESQEKPDGFVILIDEGALAGIYVIGLGWYETYSMRSDVLPFAVFNKFRLERELAAWAERKKKRVHYEIETVTAEKSAKPLSKMFDKVGVLGAVGDVREHLHEQARHNLYIYFGEPGELKGFRYGFGYSSANGIEVEGEWAKQPLFMDKDRIVVTGFVGIARRDTLDPASSDKIFYNNAGMGLQWFTPPLGKDWFRLFLDSSVANTSDQRPDLPLDQFWLLEQFHSAAAEFRMGEYKTIHVALGYRSKRAYGDDQVPGSPYTITDRFEPALATTVELEFLFGDPLPNYTLNHELNFKMVNDYRGLSDFMHSSRLSYRKVFFAKLLDTVLQTSGVFMRGEVEFFDELPLDSVGTRSSFDRKFYVEDAFSQSFEARFNLFRRDVQLGVFDDVSVFGSKNRTTGDTTVELGNAMGPAIYMTLYDAFQVYLNYAFGMATDGTRSNDLNLGLKKIF